ncbi:MAG: glycosyltransferase family 4 protein [Planctomycetales bacterium]|nr:glycosyltransferase family 4 protein [Planctomycetales bacterium]
MNIVYATRAAIPYPSAASLNTVQMCQCLTQLGHEVTLAVGRKFWRRGTRHTDWSRFYGFAPAFKVRPYFELPRTSWWFDRQITNWAAQQNALLYARYPRILPAAQRDGLTVILELHQAINVAERQWIASALQTGHLHTVVTITQALRNHLLAFPELTGYGDQFTVAPDAVDCSRFTSCCHVKRDPSRVAYFGGLFPGKGMEVIAQLARRMPHTRFDVYGGRAAELTKWRSECAALINLRFHGYVKPADVPTHMTSHAIALLPNQPNVLLPNGDDIGRFTSPMKMFEYMAAGCAIVASDLPGLREVLRHDANCLLAGHDDLPGWQTAIERLQSNADLRQRLTQTAQREAIELYSYRRRFTQILSRLEFNSAVPTTISLATVSLPARPHAIAS